MTQSSMLRSGQNAAVPSGEKTSETAASTSRIAGFYKCTRAERLRALTTAAALDAESVSFLNEGGLSFAVADGMSENVVSTFGLPLSVALNFRVNDSDVLVPMAVEEPSVVAAASNAAKMVRLRGGFYGDADAPIMTAQVQFDDVENPIEACATIERARADLLASGDAAIPSMVRRGGGCRDLEARLIDEVDGIVVCHVYIDVGDAMGANIVDTVAEALAPVIGQLIGGSRGLRILTNLPLRRLVRVRAAVDAEAVGGEAIADGIARASRFADRDPFRAVTHNKGFMNGLDAAAVAFGQDFRSIEAAAHAFAAGVGQTPPAAYRPISRWTRTKSGLQGEAELPLAVGTVGGSARAHAGVRTAFKVARINRAGDLAILLAAAGLATNLAALRALAAEGIQAGHMRLHRRKDAIR